MKSRGRNILLISGMAVGMAIELLFAQAATAKCLSIDNRAHPCRHSTGDAWCIAHGHDSFAYSDSCLKSHPEPENGKSDRKHTEAAPQGAFPEPKLTPPSQTSPQAEGAIEVEARKMGLRVPSSKASFLSTYGDRGGTCGEDPEFKEIANSIADVTSECKLAKSCDQSFGGIVCNGIRVGFNHIGSVSYFQITFQDYETGDRDYLNFFSRRYGTDKKTFKVVDGGIVTENVASSGPVTMDWIYVVVTGKPPHALVMIYALRR